MKSRAELQLMWRAARASRRYRVLSRKGLFLTADRARMEWNRSARDLDRLRRRKGLDHA